MNAADAAAAGASEETRRSARVRIPSARLAASQSIEKPLPCLKRPMAEHVAESHGALPEDAPTAKSHKLTTEWRSLHLSAKLVKQDLTWYCKFSDVVEMNHSENSPFCFRCYLFPALYITPMSPSAACL